MIEKVTHIELLRALDLPKDEYVIVGGVWMALMDIRPNNDLDLIVTKRFRKVFNEKVQKCDPKLAKKLKKVIDGSEVRAKKYIYLAKTKNAGKFVKNHFVKIDGFKVVPINLLVQYKKHRHHICRNRPRKMRSKDMHDLALIDQFFKEEKHLLPEYKEIFA